jgi:hypothetical protein
VLVLLALTAGCATVEKKGPIEIVSPPIEGFYSKRIFEGKIPILGHASVTDEGMFLARDRLRALLAGAPRIRANLEAAHHELHVIGMRQFTSELPEHRSERGKRIDTGELFDWHMIGGHIVGRFSSCTEATLIPIVGHRLFGDDPCTHELAHAVDWLGLSNRLRGTIAAAYHRSIDSGHWKGRYAAKNEHEWFAEITKHYFRGPVGQLDFYDPYLARGREWLHGEDAEAFQLVDDLYHDRIDPGARHPTRLVLGPASAESTLRSREGRTPTVFRVKNQTKQRVHLVWIDYEGRRDTRKPFAEQQVAEPGSTLVQYSYATHPFLLTDDAEQTLCTLVAGEEDAEGEITGPCP